MRPSQFALSLAVGLVLLGAVACGRDDRCNPLVDGVYTSTDGSGTLRTVTVANGELTVEYVNAEGGLETATYGLTVDGDTDPP